MVRGLPPAGHEGAHPHVAWGMSPAADAPAAPSVLRRPLWWGLAALWWTLEGIVSATTWQGMADVAWGHALRVSMTSAWLWVPQTMLALFLAERWTLGRDARVPALAVHGTAALAVVVVRALVVVAANPLVGWYATVPPFGTVLATSFANNFFAFCLVIGVGHALVHARRARERDERLARAELQYLKAQLHPHFLFNTLNAVSASVRTDPETATLIIARLGTLLRHALERGGVQEVPLEEELAILSAYVEIEQLRFEDRLRVQWAIEPGTLRAAVPHLVLQPLVENAIRHGIAPRHAPGTVEIAASRRNGHLVLAVRDDGVGMDGAPAADGVGLANTRSRLRQLYGERQTMRVDSAPGRGARVEIALPWREAVPA